MNAIPVVNECDLVYFLVLYGAALSRRRAMGNSDESSDKSFIKYSLASAGRERIMLKAFEA